MTKIHLQNKWAETNNSVCALLRQAHDVLALTSLPMEQVRKPLTDEIIDDIFRKVMNKHAYITEGLIELRREYARAVERAHGIGEKDE